MNDQSKRNSFQEMYGMRLKLKEWVTPDLNSQSFTNHTEIVFPKSII